MLAKRHLRSHEAQERDRTRERTRERTRDNKPYRKTNKRTEKQMHICSRSRRCSTADGRSWSSKTAGLGETDPPAHRLLNSAAAAA
jgi:hypothetical protein